MEYGIKMKWKERIQEKIENKQTNPNFPQRIKKGEFRENCEHIRHSSKGQENLIVFEFSEFYLSAVGTQRCYI